MKTARHWVVLMILAATVAACSRSLQDRGSTPQFEALQTAAQQTIIARQTQAGEPVPSATEAVVQTEAVETEAVVTEPVATEAVATEAVDTELPTLQVSPAASETQTPLSPAITVTTLATIDLTPAASLVATLPAMPQPTVATSIPAATAVPTSATTAAAVPTAIPPAATPAVTAASPSALRFVFAPGSASAVTGGSLPPNAVIDYLVAGKAGQMLLASVASPEENVFLGVKGVADNSTLQSPTAGKPFYNTSLTVTQDYLLSVVAPAAGSEFMLQVILPMPIAFETGAVSTVITGQVAGGEANYYVTKAQAGQTMTVRVTSPNSDVYLMVYGLSDGAPLSRTETPQASWSGPLPSAQDYMVQVFSTGQSTTYTIEITIQ